MFRDLSNWDLLPRDKDAAEKMPGPLVPVFVDTVKIEGILRNLVSKLGVFADIAAASRMALEEIVARLPGGGNHGETATPSRRKSSGKRSIAG